MTSADQHDQLFTHAWQLLDTMRALSSRHTPADLTSGFWKGLDEYARAQAVSPSWDLVERLLTLVQRVESVRPARVSELVTEIARQRQSRDALDPYAQAPAFIGRVAAGGVLSRVVALVPPGESEEIFRAVPSTVEWVTDNPMAQLVSMQTADAASYDLIACSPPLGLPVGRVIGAIPKEIAPERNEDVSEWLVNYTLPLLKADGLQVFLLQDNTFRTSKGFAAIERLGQRGAHLRAAISVPNGFGSMTAVPATLAIFSHDPAEEIFVGRLVPGQSPRQLVANLLAQKPGKAPELGRLLPLHEFRGWEAFQSRIDLERRLKTSSKIVVTLDDVATDIRRVTLRTCDMAGVPAGTAVYLHEVTGKASLEPAEQTGKSALRAYRVQLATDRVSPDYVVWWINSDLGKQARKALGEGAVIPRMSLDGVRRIPLPLPPIREQVRALALAGRIEALRSEVSDLESELSGCPMAARDLEERLDDWWTDPLAAWLQRLPFPLASILDRYMSQASSDVDGRRKRLLHFLEAFAEFSVAILLGALHRNDDLWIRRLPDLGRKTPEGKHLLQKPTFGGWVEFGAILARALRQEIQSALEQQAPNTEANRSLFGVADPDFSRELTNTRLWNTLRTASTLRNDEAHNRVLSKFERQDHLDKLEEVLDQVREATPKCFSRATLTIPGDGGLRQGVWTFARAKHLRGSRQHFKEYAVQSLTPLEADSFYFIANAEGPVQDALRVAPLFQLLPASGDEANTVYFANGVDPDGQFEMVSYHSEAAEARRSENVPELSALLDALLRL